MIDAITDGGNHIRLIIVASGEWFDAGRPLLALQQKLERYATYAVSGALVMDYPALEGKPVAIHLHYPWEPEAEVAAALTRVAPALSDLGLAVEVDILPELQSGRVSRSN